MPFGGGLSGHHGKVNDMSFCGGRGEDSHRYVATVSGKTPPTLGQKLNLIQIKMIKCSWSGIWILRWILLVHPPQARTRLHPLLQDFNQQHT